MTSPGLVTVDLDGTLLPDDTAFGVVLRGVGRGEQVAQSDRRFFAGEITLEECFWEQWRWVQPLSPQELHRHLGRAKWLADISAGCRRLRQAGLATRLLTDQPSTLADFTGRWGLTPAICSPVTVRDGEQVDIEARFDKMANLDAALTHMGVARKTVIHVGNGSNDVPVFDAVGGGVAVFAPEAVADHADVALTPESFVEVAEAVLAVHGKMESNS